MTGDLPQFMIIDTQSLLAGFFRKCDAAKSAGGIAAIDVLNGTEVPEGWKLEPFTEYFLPPNVRLV